LTVAGKWYKLTKVSEGGGLDEAIQPQASCLEAEEDGQDTAGPLKGSISALESGKKEPRSGTLARLAEALECGVDYFFN
jgi:transcriptional regulator with XRE-family HTH domain